MYRIISYNGQELVINSLVVPNTAFLMSSAKFGLWSDPKLKTIFGLGFTTQEQRDETCEWFQKIVKACEALESHLPLPPPVSQTMFDSYGDDNGNWMRNIEPLLHRTFS
jgi:hypothetical protein